jgi:hypothetical protein
VPSRDRPYLKSGRLADLFALIQVLALDEHSHPGESGLRTELQRPPKSASTWGDVAGQHPEFFRVRPGADHAISLLSRHLLPPGDTGRAPLAPAYVHELLLAAIQVHDREVEMSKRWHQWMPLLGALLGGLLSLLGTLMTLKYAKL